MRTFAHFDSTGEIQALIAVDAPDGVNGGLVPERGAFVDEVEGVDLPLDELHLEAAIEIVKSHKVAPSSLSPRKLVKK